MAFRKRQQGVVIVIALFIVALIATMAYVMMARLARDTRRTEFILHDVQAELYASGSVMWAKDTLHADWINQKKDKRVDQTPIQAPVNDMQGYKISGKINDAQGKFNLNNVSKQDWQPDFIRLMRMVYPAVTPEEAAAITKATVDWVTPGAHENEYSRYYASLPVPYRAAHRLMVSQSEWRLVKGVKEDLYQAMQPYITVLPMVTPINPMAAEPPVLAMLSADMNLETAKALQEQLQKSPPPTLEAFKALDMLKNHPIKTDRVAWVSAYFTVETDVSIEDQHILLYTLMQRNNSASKADVIVLLQSRSKD